MYTIETIIVTLHASYCVHFTLFNSVNADNVKGNFTLLKS